MNKVYKHLAASLMVLLLIISCFFIFSTSSLNSLLNNRYAGTQINITLPLANEQQSTSLIVPVASDCNKSCPTNLMAAIKVLEQSDSASNLVIFEMRNNKNEPLDLHHNTAGVVHSVHSEAPGWERINKYENPRFDKATEEVIHDANIYLYDSKLNVLLVHKRLNMEDISNDLKWLNEEAAGV